MRSLYFAPLLFLGLLVGCGSEQSLDSSLDQTELEKYVLEHPEPDLTDADARAVNQ